MKKTTFESSLFWKFFLPALFSSVGLAVGGLADSLFIGWTMNEDGLFILGATAPLYMVLAAIAIGIATGGSIHFSSALSVGKEEEGNRIFSSVFIGSTVIITVISLIGLILAAPITRLLGCAPDSPLYGTMLSYVRMLFITAPIFYLQAPLQYFINCDGAPKVAAVSMTVSMLVDCIAGFVLIVIFEQGVVATIWSTVAGSAAMEIICLIHLFKGKGAIKIKKLSLPSLAILRRSFFTGFATAAQFLYQFAVLFVFNRMLLGMEGGQGNVAIYEVVTNSSALVLSVIEAVVMAMTPLISTYYGEHNHTGVKSCLRTSITSGTSLCAAFAGILFVIASAYCGLFGLTGEYINTGVYAMRMVLSSLVIAGLNTIYGAYFQSIDKEKLSYLVTALRCLVVLLPCGILLAQKGYKAFWLCYLATEIIVLSVCAVLLNLNERKSKKQRENDDSHSVFSETFVGTCEQISEICEHIQIFLEDRGAHPKKAYFVTLAVDEVCRLIAENTDILTLQLTLVKDEDGYVLHIRDNSAVRFNPFELDEDDERALGLMLVKNQAEDFYYREFVGFNTLTIIFGG